MKLTDLVESVSDLEEYAHSQLCMEVLLDWNELNLYIYHLYIITDIPTSISDQQLKQLYETSNVPAWCYSGGDDEFVERANSFMLKDWHRRSRHFQDASNDIIPTDWASFVQIIQNYCQQHDAFENDFQE